MPVVGSFATFLQGNMKLLPHIVEATRDEGLDRLEWSIKLFTPKPPTARYATGELIESIHQSGKKRKNKYHYSGIVGTSLEYAPAIEYGSSPHVIKPDAREALQFGGPERHPVGKVKHPGHAGAHMFQKGTRTFERMQLKPIMRKQWAKLMLASKVS